jgi:hypothetical protein
MSRTLVPVLMVTALAACGGDALAPTAPAPLPFLASTEVTRTELREPINTAQFSVFNPCTNENIVNAVGTGVFTRTERVTEDGVTFIRGKIRFDDVIGFGELSGMTYTLKNQSSFTQEINVVEGGFFHQETTFRARTDGGSTLVLETELRIEFPPGLAPIVTVQTVTTECKGN